MLSKSFKIPLGFLFTGILWALFSHPIISSLAKNFSPATREVFRGLNHLGFVGVAAVVLYFEIKKQQRKLLSSEEQYRNLFERNPNPMWIYRISNLEFVKVNHATIDLYGYSKDEFFAMTIKDIRPESEFDKFMERIKLIGPGVSKHGTWIHKKNQAS